MSLKFIFFSISLKFLRLIDVSSSVKHRILWYHVSPSPLIWILFEIVSILNFRASEISIGAAKRLIWKFIGKGFETSDDVIWEGKRSRARRAITFAIIFNKLSRINCANPAGPVVNETRQRRRHKAFPHGRMWGILPLARHRFSTPANYSRTPLHYRAMQTFLESTLCPQPLFIIPSI